VIKPTIGRQVWYYPGIDPEISSNALSEQPFAATVVHVNEDETINVQVLDHFGKPHFVANCVLAQADDKSDAPAGKHHCAWMPYQKAQAAEAPAAKGEKV